MRLLGRPLTVRVAGLALHLGRSALLWWLRIHRLSRLLLVAWRRWRILAGLLLTLRICITLLLLLLLLLVVGQRLTVGPFWSVSQGYVQYLGNIVTYRRAERWAGAAVHARPCVQERRPASGQKRE